MTFDLYERPWLWSERFRDGMWQVRPTYVWISTKYIWFQPYNELVCFSSKDEFFGVFSCQPYLGVHLILLMLCFRGLFCTLMAMQASVSEIGWTKNLDRNTQLSCSTKIRKFWAKNTENIFLRYPLTTNFGCNYWKWVSVGNCRWSQQWWWMQMKSLVFEFHYKWALVRWIEASIWSGWGFSCQSLDHICTQLQSLLSQWWRCSQQWISSTEEGTLPIYRKRSLISTSETTRKENNRWTWRGIQCSSVSVKKRKIV